MTNETKTKINLQYFAEDPKAEVKAEPKGEETQPRKQEGEFNSAAEFKKAYEELKNNSVPKEQYEKARSEIAEMTKALIDGTKISAPKGEEPVKEKSIKELAKGFTEGGLENLEMAKRALAYRDAVIKEFGVDPMVDIHSDDPEGDEQKAQNYVDVLTECIDNSGGSNTVFTAMFNERIKDTPIANAKAKGRRA